MMHKGSTLLSGSVAVIAGSAIAGTAMTITTPALAQSVADSALSDVQVQHVGQCSTLAINFNIRVQVLSYFPTNSGREVHVRVRPLDAGALGLIRESLRTPSSVPALRSIEYEGDNPSGPVLSLFFSHDMRFEVEAGEDPRTIIIRLAELGSGPICEPSEDAGQAPAVSPDLAIPEGLYVVNLLSQPETVGDLSGQQRDALSGRVLYETLFDRDAQQWHRLRAGFYSSRSEAEAARERLGVLFPEAFVVKVSSEERAQGVANRLDGSNVPTIDTSAASTASSEEAARAKQLVAEAEAAIAEGNNDRAVQILTNALELPVNSNSPRALELLGLTRERKGQLAHAQAEYEEYLRRYPTGEAADRVRQRLAALQGSSAGSPELREATVDSAGWNWGARGSLSQFYYRDQSNTKFVDASKPELDPEVDNSVNLNQLLTSADLTVSGGNAMNQLQMRAAGSYTANFRDGGKDIKAVTALYLDYQNVATDMSLRFGRQTRNGSGVLGRFDGMLVGWQASPKLRINAVGGFPVLTSRQTYLLKERYFYGVSVDVGARRSPVQATLYWFDQRASGGFIDRQAVGFEGRLLLPRFNAFTIVDYDVKYKELNLGLLTLNYSFPDNSNFSLTADYRKSPLLTTTNGLIGQIFTSDFRPVADLRDLKPFFTDAEIYQLARDRTLTSKSLTASYSRPLTGKLQSNFDFTLTNTGGTPGTPASAGTEEVLPLPETGTEYYYGAQVVGTGLLWDNDIFILSGRYADTQRARTYTADLNARVPITGKIRLSPRLRYGYRDSKVTPQTPVPGRFWQLQPTVRLNIYPMRHGEIELEVGSSISRQTEYVGGNRTTIKETGFLFNAGYRIDF